MEDELRREHPRTLGWVGTTALAMGGSNQSLFLLGALVAAQGTAAVPLLVVGLLLSWMALPGWIELVLMWPDRVGGIASTCAEAFRPYSPVLANLTGTCYWWGWVPTCGLTALLSANAVHEWFLPSVSATHVAVGIVLLFTLINLAGVKWATRTAVAIAAGSAALAFLSTVIPVFSGNVDWHRATSWHLTLPFHGPFAALTSAMAGLYLVGFAAPAFEAAACHVGEMIDPERNVPRAMYASALMATLYFVAIPIVWLGALGPTPLTGDLASTLGPTFGPLLGGGAKAAATAFMVLNMFHGTLAPVTGVCRTLSQLSEDGLLPRILGRRNRRDAPWVAITFTGLMASAFLLGGDPVWVVAAANLCYLLGIALPSVAVWLLRRNEPDRPRPYRASNLGIRAGVCAAIAWGIATVFGMEQFGMPTVMLSLVLAFSGGVAYAWRVREDRDGSPRIVRWPLHLKLTGLMLFTMALDGAGYLLAVQNADRTNLLVITALKDIFVCEALLTIAVGLVVPGTIANAAMEVADAGRRLATGTLADLTRSFRAIRDGELDAIAVGPPSETVLPRTKDEVGFVATTFNLVVDETRSAVEAVHAAQGALAASRAALVHQAMHDPLTGLPNRAFFREHLAASVHQAGPGRQVAVIFADIDRFKIVNDSLGHVFGDLLLQTVGQRIVDCVPAGATVARFGGDEFIVLLHGLRSAAEVDAITDMIAAAVARHVRVAGAEMTPSLSMGVAIADGPLDDPESLLRDADTAMYAAKDAGRSQTVHFAHTLRTRVTTRMDLESSIRRALAEDELVLHYQPIVDLESRHVVGLEALVRWQHPTRGLVGPLEFIPIAEETGLIAAVTDFVLDTTLSEWADGDLYLGVNLSASQLDDSGLVDRIVRSIDASGVDPGRIVIELTESTIMRNAPVALRALQDLKAAGVRLSIDDFGTGYSSLAYLKRFPVDVLKIDKSFVDGLGADTDADAIVRAILDLARSLGLGVVAEGVETKLQADLLLDMGCTRAQGHLFAAAAPAAALRASVVGAVAVVV